MSQELIHEPMYLIHVLSTLTIFEYTHLILCVSKYFACKNYQYIKFVWYKVNFYLQSIDLLYYKLSQIQLGSSLLYIKWDIIDSIKLTAGSPKFSLE